MTKTANKISFILIVAAIAVIMSILSINAAAEETVGSGSCGENLTWTLDDGGTLTISGTGIWKIGIIPFPLRGLAAVL